MDNFTNGFAPYARFLLKQYKEIIMELYPYKQAAIFVDEQTASKVEKQLTNLQLPKVKFFVLSPDLEDDENKLEPESNEIRNRFIRNALIGGVAGAFVGVIIYLILKSINPDFFIDNPALADITGLSVIGSFIGAIIGVLFGAKIKEDAFLGTLQDTLKQGKWGVMVHAEDKAASAKITKIIEDMNIEDKIMHN